MQLQCVPSIYFLFTSSDTFVTKRTKKTNWRNATSGCSEFRLKHTPHHPHGLDDGCYLRTARGTVSRAFGSAQRGMTVM